jgi:hypothetical protein
MSDSNLTSRRELRHFGFGASAGLALLALAAHGGRGPAAWLGAPEPFGSMLLAAAAIWVAGCAWLAPRWNAPLERVLRAIAGALAFASLVVFFYGVLTPVGIAARLAGHDPLWIRPASRRDSYWKRRKPRDKQSYFNQS